MYPVDCSSSRAADETKDGNATLRFGPSISSPEGAPPFLPRPMPPLLLCPDLGKPVRIETRQAPIPTRDLSPSRREDASQRRDFFIPASCAHSPRISFVSGKTGWTTSTRGEDLVPSGGEFEWTNCQVRWRISAHQSHAVIHCRVRPTPCHGRNKMIPGRKQQGGERHPLPWFLVPWPGAPRQMPSEGGGSKKRGSKRPRGPSKLWGDGSNAGP